MKCGERWSGLGRLGLVRNEFGRQAFSSDQAVLKDQGVGLAAGQGCARAPLCAPPYMTCWLPSSRIPLPNPVPGIRAIVLHSSPRKVPILSSPLDASSPSSPAGTSSRSHTASLTAWAKLSASWSASRAYQVALLPGGSAGPLWAEGFPYGSPYARKQSKKGLNLITRQCQIGFGSGNHKSNFFSGPFRDQTNICGLPPPSVSPSPHPRNRGG